MRKMGEQDVVGYTISGLYDSAGDISVGMRA